MSYSFAPGSMESSCDDVSNDAATIDSSEVEKRIAELLAQIGRYENMYNNDEEIDEDDREAWENHEAELKKLTALREAAEHFCNWYSTGGATLVRDDNLVKYAQERSEEIHGADFTTWPFNRVDWEAAAQDMVRYDWKPVDYDGVTYWVLAT